MLPRFELYMPADLSEACVLKREGAKPVAGGTDVFVDLYGGKEKKDALVDIKRIPELQGISFSQEKGLSLGALTSHRSIEVWDLAREHFFALYKGCSQVGSVQIRYRGTIGGNIMNGAPSADSIGPMLVHGADCIVAGPDGERRIPLIDYYTGFKKHDCAANELLARIEMPAPPENSGSAYFKYGRRNAMDLALMGVSAYMELEDSIMKNVRIALTTAAPTPVRSFQAEKVLEGETLSDEVILAAADAVASEGKPRSSWRSSAEFRVRLLHDITILVLHEAAARAALPFSEKAKEIPFRTYAGMQGLEPRPVHMI